jgi:hypothetical protein
VLTQLTGVTVTGGGHTPALPEELLDEDVAPEEELLDEELLELAPLDDELDDELLDDELEDDDELLELETASLVDEPPPQAASSDSRPTGAIRTAARSVAAAGSRELTRLNIASLVMTTASRSVGVPSYQMYTTKNPVPHANVNLRTSIGSA